MDTCNPYILPQTKIIKIAMGFWYSFSYHDKVRTSLTEKLGKVMTELSKKTYIGTKLVKMIKMNREEYNYYRGWELPADENGLDQGYLVEYADGGKPNDSRHKGYISWSPKDVADRHYYPVDEMTFGMAIEAAKLGYKISRKGWNGKGMWVIFNPGSLGDTYTMSEGSVYKKHGVDECEILPHFDMYTVNAEGRRAMLPGWLASQTDMIACDWGIV